MTNVAAKKVQVALDQAFRQLADVTAILDRARTELITTRQRSYRTADKSYLIDGKMTEYRVGETVRRDGRAHKVIALSIKRDAVYLHDTERDVFETIKASDIGMTWRE